MSMGSSLTTPKPGNPQPVVQFDIPCKVPIEEVIKISEDAGKAILEIYNSEDLGVVSKADDSPLTKADTAANKVICDGLERLFPHIPIISEETKQRPYEIRQNYEYCWIVDPLDGTKEFVKRNGEFTVMIALVQGQVPVLGVVHVPVTGTTYYAVEGQGAFKRHQGTNTQIHCAEFDPMDVGLTLVGSASHPNPATKEFVELFKEPGFKALGSSLKLTMVAEGEAHVYPRLHPTMEWDVAAADIIVKEAGGVVVHAGKMSGKGEFLEEWRDVVVKELPMEYNKPDLLNPAFVAFGKRRPAAQT